MLGPPSKPRRVANSSHDAMLLSCASQSRALPDAAAARTVLMYSSTLTLNAEYTGFSSAGVDAGMNWLSLVAFARPAHGTGMRTPPRRRGGVLLASAARAASTFAMVGPPAPALPPLRVVRALPATIARNSTFRRFMRAA